MGIRRPPLSRPAPTRRQSTLWTARPGPCAAATNLEDARLVTGGRKRLRAPPLLVAGSSSLFSGCFVRGNSGFVPPLLAVVRTRRQLRVFAAYPQVNGRSGQLAVLSAARCSTGIAHVGQLPEFWPNPYRRHVLLVEVRISYGKAKEHCVGQPGRFRLNDEALPSRSKRRIGFLTPPGIRCTQKTPAHPPAGVF